MGMSAERPAAAPALAAFVPLMLVGLAATGALKLATLGATRLECWVLLPLVAMLAWPLWAWRREQSMFVRRLLLAGATTETGRLRRWLWRGTATQTLGVLPALAWAAALLLTATQLTPLQWGILVVDAVLLAALSPLLRHALRHEVAPQFVGTVARRWPVLLGNTAVLLAAFVAHDYFVGFPDTRTLSWDALVTQSMRSAQDGVTCPGAAALIGVASLADRLPRHAALLFLPGVANTQAKMLGWLVFLACTGFAAYLFTRFVLGTQALWDRRTAQGSHSVPSSGWFAGAALVVMATAMLLGARGYRLDAGALGLRATQWATLANPCARQTAQAAALRSDAQRQLDAAARQAVDSAMQPVERGLELAFAAAEKGVDAYLDWYFSFVGSYTRLGALVIPDLDTHMRQKFTTHVFTDSGFDPAIAGAVAQADALLLARIAAEADAIGQGIATQLKLQPCLHESVQLGKLPALQRDTLRLALSAAVALPLSRVVLPLALHAGEAVLARAAARQTVRAAASAAGSTAGKRGASVVLSAGAASALCAPGGPLALACGIVAGAVTWLGVDMALIAIDEALFRKSLRAELVEELQAQHGQLRQAMRTQLEQAASTYSTQAAVAVDKLFVPAVQH
jgi:hypothetical protein